MAGDRHFAKYEPNGEEVIILGYRQKTNDVLIAFPSAMSQQEAQDFRRIVQGSDAQSKDFLMDVVGGSVLQAAHHPSGVDWQTHLVRQGATGRSAAVRRVTMKDLDFYDQTQKAYFGGYGESIEPEVDALRKQRIQAQDAALHGRPLPEPTDIRTPVPAAPAPVAAPVDTALVDALGAIAASQKAILEQLATMSKPAPRKTTTRKKTTRKKPVASKKPAMDDTLTVVQPDIVTDVSVDNYMSG